MKRKLVGVALAASLAASVALPPAANAGGYGWWSLAHHPHHHHHFIPGSGHLNAWPAFYIIGAAASVMLDAAIVWNTQCRELTSQEAFASAFLPVVGFAFDTYDNKCKR
jgi:hypothetical protein